MWNVKWIQTLMFIVTVKCSMIVGNYRKFYCALAMREFSARKWLRETHLRSFLPPLNTVPETKSPYDPSNFWHELSSPYNEADDYETTTHVHEPFFEENSTQINVTTQLGSHVYLHCRVNDLREKMVSCPSAVAFIRS